MRAAAGATTPASTRVAASWARVSPVRFTGAGGAILGRERSSVMDNGRLQEWRGGRLPTRNDAARPCGALKHLAGDGSIGVQGGALHAGGIERHDHLSIDPHGDQAAFAAQGANLV